MPGLLSEELRKEYPEIEASADFLSEQLDYTTEAKEYLSLKTLCVDSAFLQVFPQRAVAGDLAQALQRAGSMVLTESAAIRLCGDAEKALLAENLFVVHKTYNDEFYELYESNRYNLTPNFITVDGKNHPDCGGSELGLCDQCGFCMAGEMHSVMTLRPDTILAGLKLRM